MLSFENTSQKWFFQHISSNEKTKGIKNMSYPEEKIGDKEPRVIH